MRPNHPIPFEQLRSMLTDLWEPDVLTIVITQGEARRGHAIVRITDINADQHDEALSILAQSTPRTHQLHHLTDVEVITTPGVAAP